MPRQGRHTGVGGLGASTFLVSPSTAKSMTIGRLLMGICILDGAAAIKKRRKEMRNYKKTKECLAKDMKRNPSSIIAFTMEGRACTRSEARSTMERFAISSHVFHTEPTHSYVTRKLYKLGV